MFYKIHGNRCQLLTRHLLYYNIGISKALVTLHLMYVRGSLPGHAKLSVYSLCTQDIPKCPLGWVGIYWGIKPLWPSAHAGKCCLSPAGEERVVDHTMCVRLQFVHLFGSRLCTRGWVLVSDSIFQNFSSSCRRADLYTLTLFAPSCFEDTWVRIYRSHFLMAWNVLDKLGSSPCCF